MTIAQTYFDFAEKLKTIYNDREADNISDWVFENVTGLKRWERRENKNSELKENMGKKIDNYLQELLLHKPVQYVLNEAWFYKMKFFVDENVLIPRPETEELVEWIVQDAGLSLTAYHSPLTILDIGTGSGCIAIALKNKIKNADVFAIDVSEPALKIAALNAQKNNTDINFSKADILQNQIKINIPLFDVIVSNPPYITKKESTEMHTNIIAYEPHLALFVPDENPLLFYNAISDFALSHLKEKGNLYFEIHENFANDIVNLMQQKGFQSIEIKKDLQQKNRMVKAVLNK